LKIGADQGDVVWLDFDPRAGHEQAGRRPAVVLTPRSYNTRSGLALVCPITSKAKGYPFEVPVSAGQITGVVLSDHVSSLDWSVRNAAYVSRVPEATLAEIMAKIAALLQIDD
jgi:mRNA interferase MazF